MKTALFAACAAAASVVAASTSVAAGWNEAVDGNLSNNFMAPTAITVGAGVNTVQGSLPVFGSDQYRDYVTFTVPAGFALVSLKVAAASNSKGNNGSVVGIAAGSAFAADPNNHSVNTNSGLLGFTFFGPASVGSDLLPVLAVPNASPSYPTPGFAVPVTSGTYSLWVQDYDNPATYSLALRFEAMVAPTLKVTRKLVGAKTATLKGTVTGSGTKVSYKVSKGKFRAAKGKVPGWSFTLKGLKKGRNVITIRAQGDFGTTTKKETVSVK